MDLCCIMMMLGCILSGISILFVQLAMFYLYCPWWYHCRWTSYHEELSLQASWKQAMFAFHLFALLWCIATCVIFGVGMCAPKCREDNKAFMVGLLICCGLCALCDLIATSLFGYYVYPGSPPRGICHSDEGECINVSIMFGFLLFALLNSAACCAFAGVACAVKDQSKKARLQAEKDKPKPAPRRRAPPRSRSPRRNRRQRPRESTPIYYYDDDYYYY